MKLYAFDDATETLELLPMAARRALDVAGLKLSRERWLDLPYETRVAIVEAGAEERVSLERVHALCGEQSSLTAATDDPVRDMPPRSVVEAFAPVGGLAPAVWFGLSALDRYTLAKVAARPRPDRIAAAYREIVGATALSTHLRPTGEVRMVDVAPKDPTQRRAVAESLVRMDAAAFERIASATAGKGDVLSTARIAGIMAAKRTPELIPLCHGIAITKAHVDLALDADDRTVRIVATIESFDRTGVEMEAMVAASVAALTVYDMLKAYDRAMEVGPTRLLEKSGGRSGTFRR